MAEMTYGELRRQVNRVANGLEAHGISAGDPVAIAMPMNLEAVLAAAGGSLDSVVKTTVYLADMADFVEMNGEYERAFGSHAPARATVQVSRLPKDARVEIDCIAVL